MAEIIFKAPAALLLIPLFWTIVLVFAWPRRFKPFGAFILRLIIIVLVGLALAQPVILPNEDGNTAAEEKLVLLVDQSASITAADQQKFQAEITRLTEQHPEATVLYFSDQAVVLPPGEQTPELPLNPEISNLAEALQAGANLLHNQPGRLVLFSDGLPTTGNTQAAVNQLARQNIPVDVFNPDAIAAANDIYLTNVVVPSTLRPGETFDVEVLIYSPYPTEAQLKLIQDDQPLNQSPVALEPGFNRFTFSTQAKNLGPHTFQATLIADDAQSLNNSLSAFSQVYPSSQILVVGDNPTATAAFSAGLEQAGFIPQTISSSELPDRLSALEPYSGMVLLNVSARKLKLEQMIAVQEFVRSYGRGLVVTGGRNSFSLGSYADTPLAELLPVSLEPPVREERPPVALLLVIDHSGSMIEEREPVTRMVMAKEAAIRATNILGPQDLIGVLIFDSDYEWVVPFQQVSDGATLLQIQEKISRIPGGSATRILQALEVSIPELIGQQGNTGARHAVLFSDGKSYDGERGIADYEAVVDAALAADITMSTISIGAGTDETLLAHLAERGQGRYHYASVPEELPELTIAESDILRSSAVQEGEYEAAAPAPHPIVRDFVPASAEEGLNMPALSGYIAMTPKLWSESALQVGPGDPLLSVWGYGLGRVAAWSSDIGQEWATNWVTWPDTPRFWGQVVEYTLPAPDLGLLQLQADIDANGVVTLTADGVTGNGETADLNRTEVVLITPGGREVPVNLRQVSPGRYQQRLQINDPGVYQMQATQTRPNGDVESTTSGFVVPYPTEYSLPSEGTGAALLKQIPDQTGGQILLEQSQVDTTASEIAANITPEPTELWPWLLLTALILWPVEIAWRRWGRLRIQ